MSRASDGAQIKIIGRNIERLLFEADMTQSDLAAKLGLSESAITNWVTGRNAPSMGNVQRIADFFRVPKSMILEENVARNSVRSREQTYLFDRIANASEEDLRKLSKLLDIIENEKNNS